MLRNFVMFVSLSGAFFSFFVCPGNHCQPNEMVKNPESNIFVTWTGNNCANFQWWHLFWWQMSKREFPFNLCFANWTHIGKHKQVQILLLLYSIQTQQVDWTLALHKQVQILLLLYSIQTQQVDWTLALLYYLAHRIWSPSIRLQANKSPSSL